MVVGKEEGRGYGKYNFTKKINMKRLLVLLLLSLMLVGCGSPEASTDKPAVVEPVDCSAVEAEYAVLVGKFATVEANYKLQKSYYDALKASYDTLLSNLDVRSQGFYKSLESLMAQHQDLQEKYDEIWQELNRVNDRKDIMITENMTLSDNLTESELEAFYKGWDLWWETVKE